MVLEDWQGRFTWKDIGFLIFCLNMNYNLPLLSPEWGDGSSLIHNLESKIKYFAHPDFFFNPTTYKHGPCSEKLLKLNLLSFVHWITRKIFLKTNAERSYFLFLSPVELNFVSERLFLKYIVRCCSFSCEKWSPLPNMHSVFVPCYEQRLWWVAVICQMKNEGSVPRS